MNLEDIRQFFAEEIRVVANIQTSALVTALAQVPREQFLGPGPWQIPIIDTCATATGGAPGTRYRNTEDADPRHLYHNVPIAIDPSRNLNNGQPGSLASWIDALELKEGDHAVHIGCAVGYYTAIIAAVVGPSGRVTGIEIDPDLALRARNNLAHLGHVEVLEANGGDYKAPLVDAIFVNAGATQVRSAWLHALRPGGRLLFPLTIAADPNVHGTGFMIRVKHEAAGFAARFVSTVMIFPCIGSRDEESNQRLLEAVKRGTWGSVQSVRVDTHEASDTCWLHSERVCLSTLQVG
jgi:protein-L-isoaspartate(D-aspartate) O-methyltransferase